MRPQVTVLVSTMDRADGCRDLIEQMGITGDAVMVNQCGKTASERVATPHGSVLVLSSENRGIGRSRNLAFAHAAPGIVLFADDDVQYDAGYVEAIIQAFRMFPDADVVLFELESDDPDRGGAIREESGRVFTKALKYGGPKIAVRTESVRRARISFSEVFGGGAPYAAGEDSLFIRDCLLSGLRVYRSGDLIGRIAFDGSSWFAGYNVDYLHDRGALYKSMFGSGYPLVSLIFALKHRGKFAVSTRVALRELRNGARCVSTWQKCDRHAEARL